MLRILTALFRSKPHPPVKPFIDPVLGGFTFDNELGWKKNVAVGETQAELVIGYDGERPSNEMLQTARMWVANWVTEKPKILEYIRTELRNWMLEPDLPDPDRFVLQSINVLWTEDPTTCMIYLDYPDDYIRLWHVTFDGMTPRGFAYDD